MLCGESSGSRWNPMLESSASLPEDSRNGAWLSRSCWKALGPAPLTGWSCQIRCAVDHRS